MAELKIKNWERFQHYKDRNPPWIKLHYDLLSSRDWVVLDDASRLLAVVCMLLASRHDGYVPNDPEFIQRVAYLGKKVNLQPLIDCGFLLADASTCLQTVANDTTEERREEERRGEVPFSDFWDLYPRHESKVKADKKWKSLSVKNQRAAMAALPNHIARWEDPKFIPHATTWLNQERWKDELDPIVSAPSNLMREIKARAKALDSSYSAVKNYYETHGTLPFEKEQVSG